MYYTEKHWHSDATTEASRAGWLDPSWMGAAAHARARARANARAYSETLISRPSISLQAQRCFEGRLLVQLGVSCRDPCGKTTAGCTIPQDLEDFVALNPEPETALNPSCWAGGTRILNPVWGVRAEFSCSGSIAFWQIQIDKAQESTSSWRSHMCTLDGVIIRVIESTSVLSKFFVAAGHVHMCRNPPRSASTGTVMFCIEVPVGACVSPSMPFQYTLLLGCPAPKIYACNSCTEVP